MSTTAIVYVDPDGPAIKIPAFIKAAHARGLVLSAVVVRADDRLADRPPLAVLTWHEDDPADAGNAS